MATRGRPVKTSEKQNSNQNYLDKVSQELESNQSRLSMILGALILVVVGILIFNYFNKNKSSLGPAQQTDQTLQDVSPNNLPGKYTVKEGDTLFIIADKYYQDGSKFEDIAKANDLKDIDSIEVGQVLEIPKLELSPSGAPSVNPEASPSETPAASPSENPSQSSPPTSSQEKSSELGTGGSNTTIWGPNITTNTYTVQEGDWLSTISARAYGDIFSFQKIAQANNITNPDFIVPGQILKIPR